MDEADKYSLSSISGYITDNLDAKYVLDHLIEAEVLDPDDDEEIRAEKTSRKRTERLLEILPNSRPDALKHFKNALQKDYRHIVQKLNAVQVPAQIKKEAQPGAVGQSIAAASTTAAVRSQKDGGVTTTTKTHAGVTSRTTNITGNNNFVIIGGTNTTINYH
ncbi:uncharacterized protein LOC110982455 [Acanthaster planci]|uniref:Uncharacterized protein LOC110982455 n=1 Tax=Acanthaster planci TaxID=133434 RepID=A0A8B7YV25_ACAPL|nr:uncharacterized protein LOC110982455 [Acanthaster planci]XP_022096543.1 uncharacterized protein LOC110982455 [Acanthaster planci]